MLANTKGWVQMGERQGSKCGGEPGWAGATRSLRGPRLDSRPLLSVPRRAGRRGQSVEMPAPVPESVTSELPASHRPGPGCPGLGGLGRVRTHHPGVRPLTFTFPASRPPSFQQRHPRASVQGQAEEGRTRASPAAAGLPLWLR